MNTLFQLVNKITAHQVFRQFSWYAVGQSAIQLFSFLGVVVISRYLGPTNIGLYSFVQNYLAVSLTIVIGMDFYFIWNIAKSDQKIDDLAEYFWHKLNITILLTLLGIVVAWVVLPKDVAALATVMFTPLSLTSFSAFLQYAIATNNARIIALIQVGVAAMIFVAKIILVVTNAPLIAFVTVNALDVVLLYAVIGAFYLSRKEIRKTVKEKVIPSLWSTLRFMYSIKMSIIAIALWQLILRIDQLILATFSNAYTLGIYAAAVKIAEVPNFLAGILYTALVGHVAFFANKDDNHSKHRIKQVLLLYAVIGTVIAFFVILVAPYAISILYGSQFISSVSVLRAYALSIPGMFVTLHYFGVYGARDQHVSQAAIFTFGLFLNILLVYVFTPMYGLSGAAYATATAYTVVAGIFYFHVR